MKTSKYIFFTALMFCWLGVSWLPVLANENSFVLPDAGTNCETFDTGAGNWAASNATVSWNNTTNPSDPFLQGADNVNPSIIFSNDYSGDFSCRSICFRYRIISDGFNNQVLSIPINIMIYQGNAGNPTLRARFLSETTITENDGWVSACVRLTPGSVPENWTMLQGDDDDWDALINNMSGIAFTTDVSGLGGNPNTIGEVIGVDDICVGLLRCCPAPQDCYDFDTGVGPWQSNVNATIGISSAAPMADGTPYLIGGDDNGSSWIYNDHFCEDNDLTCTQLCFDYKVVEDGFFGSGLNIPPNVTIYQGDLASPTLMARFLSSTTVTDADDWVNICLSLSGAGIPEGWTMLVGTEAQWPELLADISGIAFTTDVAGLGGNPNTIGEIIGVDNVCITEINEPAMDATVYLQPSDFGPLYHTLSPVGYEAYSGFDVTHEWYLFSAPTVDGPYTPVAYYEGETFAYEVAEYETFYFLAHQVTGQCSEDCQTTYNNNGGSEERNQGGETERANFNCDHIDDFSDCSDLSAPTNLSVQAGFLTWSPVAGATSYIVNATIGGQNGCHCGGGPGQQVGLGNTENPYLAIGDALASQCFSWSVIAVCGEEGASPPSEIACHYPSQFMQGGDKDNEDLIEIPDATARQGERAVKIYPNPATDILTITAGADLLLQRIELHNSAGQIVFTRAVETDSYNEAINVGLYPPGLYYLRLIDHSGEISTKKVVVQ